MAQGGVLGKRTRLAFSPLPVASPVVWTKLPDILNIDVFFNQVSNDIDTTVYSDSTIETTMPGLSAAPEISFSQLWDADPSTSAAYATIRAAKVSGVNLKFRVEVATDRDPAINKFFGETFDGYIKALERTAPSKDKRIVKVIIKYAGNYVEDTVAGVSQIG